MRFAICENSTPRDDSSTGYAVRRATIADETVAWATLEEYSRALEVVARDTPRELRKYLLGPGALWLAESDQNVVGCVAFRPLPEIAPNAGEVKRLYVRLEHRGLGIARALMDALEVWARTAGLETLYLDSKDDLHAAIAFYERRGYERIPRYNDNPQATIFMRRRL